MPPTPALSLKSVSPGATQLLSALSSTMRIGQPTMSMTRFCPLSALKSGNDSENCTTKTSHWTVTFPIGRRLPKEDDDREVVGQVMVVPTMTFWDGVPSAQSGSQLWTFSGGEGDITVCLGRTPEELLSKFRVAAIAQGLSDEAISEMDDQ